MCTSISIQVCGSHSAMCVLLTRNQTLQYVVRYDKLTRDLSARTTLIRGGELLQFCRISTYM